MALELDGQQRRKLREALIHAFPGWDKMNRLLSDQLDERLAVIVGEGNDLETVAFELIEWARARGLLVDLVVAARNQNPGNPKLEVLARKLGLSSTDAPKSTLEKVVSTNTTFLDVAEWRAKLIRREWRVGRVDRDGDGVGTGFLVGPDLLLTNYHVVKPLLNDPAQANRWSCRFDYKLAETGDVISMGREVGFAADWRIDDSPYSQVDLEPDPKSGDPGDDELDFALLRLAKPVGNQGVGKGERSAERGWVKLDAAAVNYGAKKVVAILQHPRTLPLKLALGMEEELKLNAAGNRLRHAVPTEPGSSGSPLFDSDWRLIALHHAGDPATVKPEFNEAIPIAKIASRPKVAEALPEDEE